jgi:hypothetical protein
LLPEQAVRVSVVIIVASPTARAKRPIVMRSDSSGD